MRALVLALALPSPAIADDPTPGADAPAPESRLEGVREHIAALARRLKGEIAERDELADRLRDSETAAARLATELRAIEKRTRANRERIEALRARAAELDGRIADGLQALAAEVRTGYALGRRDRIRLILNQEDPATASRMLVYHAYFGRARARRVARLREALASAREVEGELAAATADLERLGTEKRAAGAALERERAARRELLAAMEGRIADGSRRLERLRADEKRLAKLLDGLRRQLADIPLALDRTQDFSALAGHLPWPTKGAVRRRFGEPRRGGMRWRGVLVGAEEGAPVRAIRRGRVAFADWLRGYGLLVIIDHGSGFMSLYGHNETLLKQPGDWVEDGEQIAAVGDSGGNATAGLYFEIRRGGKPLDPLRWLTRHPT